MSDSEDEKPSQSGNAYDFTDDDDDDDDNGPSTSWGVKRRNKRPIISDSENDDDVAEETIRDYAESCDTDSSSGAPGAETCAICLGRMRGEVGSPESCEHTFCKFCILEWAKNNPTCPQDRIPFTVVRIRKTLDGPIDKEVPIKKEQEVVEFIDLTDAENATYCEVCNQCDREERLLLCDGCDLGYHLECLDPPLSQVPVEEWFCPVCAAANVPDVLTSRGAASSSQQVRQRRETSRSRRSTNQQQEPRLIPRTRATERIRERIQKKRKIKKRLKRRRQRENKRAKIESGEIEDTRPAIARLTEFRHFVQGDNDVDAAQAEDSFAEQLLAGGVLNTARRKVQRKEDAARRLRDVAFIPQASYAGRTKNRVIDIVNTQSENNDTDLLSGILENQTIAFSSAKKLVLTNDRKFTKQPGVEVSCNIFEEESFLSEPLPSQRKTPETNDCKESSDPSEGVASCPEKVMKEDDKSADSENMLQSPSTSTYHRSSYRKDRDGHHSRRPDDYDRNGYHNRRHDDYHAKYSPHKRHSSWQDRKPQESTSSSHNSDYKGRSSSYRSNEKDRRDYYKRNYGSSDRHDVLDMKHGNYHSKDRYPHDRSKSSERESRKEKYGRSHGYGSHSSRFHKSRYNSKERSSHSSSSGDRPIRSQWSFNYFNSDSSLSRNSSNPSISASKEHDNKTGDVRVLESEAIATKPASQESESIGSLTGSKVGNICGAESDSVGKQTSISGTDELVYARSNDSSPAKEDYTCLIGDAKLQSSCMLLEYNKNAFKNYETDIKDMEEQIDKKHHSLDESLDDSDLERFDIQGQTNYSFHDLPIINVQSKNKNKNLVKSSFGKKTKISALFGDMEDDDNANVDEIEKEHSKVDRKYGKEREGKLVKPAKKDKSKDLFGCDSDNDSQPDAVPPPPHTKSEYPEGTGKESADRPYKEEMDAYHPDSKKSKCGSRRDHESEHVVKPKGTTGKGEKLHDYCNAERSMGMKVGGQKSGQETCHNQETSTSCNGKTKETKKVSENFNSKESDLGKNTKSDSKCSEGRYKGKGKHKSKDEKRRGKNSNFSELFGDIEDIGSSSSSNLFGKEMTDNQTCTQLNKNIEKPEEKVITFYGKIDKGEEVQKENLDVECSNNSDWMLDSRRMETENGRGKEVETIGSYSTSKHKSSSGVRQEDDNRIKQKAALELKVVQEVKKYLNPYYRDKSINKDEYKQIVAKCVKKVVSAECGDVIESEKMNSLVLAYVKVYKHRQKKSHS